MKTFTLFGVSAVVGTFALSGCGGGGGSNSGTRPTPTTSPTAGPVQLQDLTTNLNPLYVSSGDFEGAFIVAKGGAGINWYFANLGLARFVDSADKAKIRAYLDEFMARTNIPAGTILDYENIAPAISRASDSDDSYVSTALSLACAYRRTTNDNEWWNANKANLKTIARKALLEPQKSSGLIKVRITGNDTGFLMDNCENYAGLRDFAAELGKDGDVDAPTYATAAQRVAQGINGLFKGDHFEAADIKADKTFYPLRVAQVFPQLYDVPLGTAAQTKNKYDKGWAYLNAVRNKGENWTIGQNTDKSAKGFPYMLLGAVAAKRGEKGLAQAQLKFFLDKLNNSGLPEFSHIQEIGFANQLQSALK